MNPNWRSFLESADGVFDGETSGFINFGDSNAELLTASKQTVLVPLTHLGLPRNTEARIVREAQSLEHEVGAVTCLRLIPVSPSPSATL